MLEAKFIHRNHVPFATHVSYKANVDEERFIAADDGSGEIEYMHLDDFQQHDPGGRYYRHQMTHRPWLFIEIRDDAIVRTFVANTPYPAGLHVI